MRTVILAVSAAAALGLAAPAAMAQDQGKVEAARLAIETERTALITANLPLTSPRYSRWRGQNA